MDKVKAFFSPPSPLPTPTSTRKEKEPTLSDALEAKLKDSSARTQDSPDLFDWSDLSVLDPNDAMTWYPSAADEFRAPRTCVEIDAIVDKLKALPNGSVLAIRGRDTDHANKCFTPWVYGIAVKMHMRLFMLFDDGASENFLIDIVDYLRLVHFAKKKAVPSSLLPLPTSIERKIPPVVIISHGWSPYVGPNYPIIRTLESWALKKGWKAIVPDFRESYEFDSSRGRSERVRLIYQELLCLDPKPEFVVLVGHSQGGAASAHACTPQVVKAVNIVGLMMVGSEDPIHFDRMAWKPPVKHFKMVHASGDAVIGPHEAKGLAGYWGVEFEQIESTVRQGASLPLVAVKHTSQLRQYSEDDVHHDFLAKDLMKGVVNTFGAFLDQCFASALSDSGATTSVSPDSSSSSASSPPSSTASSSSSAASSSSSASSPSSSASSSSSSASSSSSSASSSSSLASSSSSASSPPISAMCVGATTNQPEVSVHA